MSEKTIPAIGARWVKIITANNLFALIIAALIITIFQSQTQAISQTIDFNIDGCYIGAFVNWKTVDDNHHWKPTTADIKEFENDLTPHRKRWGLVHSMPGVCSFVIIPFSDRSARGC